jgi:hypothetical protein
MLLLSGIGQYDYELSIRFDQTGLIILLYKKDLVIFLRLNEEHAAFRF